MTKVFVSPVPPDRAFPSYEPLILRIFITVNCFIGIKEDVKGMMDCSQAWHRLVFETTSCFQTTISQKSVESMDEENLHAICWIYIIISLVYDIF